MVDYEKPTVRPEIGKFFGFDHVTFWVGNAKQAAAYYTGRLGFEYLAYEGLETGNRDFATHVVSNGKIIFAFRSPLGQEGKEEFHEHHAKHGDGVKDVAFTVDDPAGIFQKAVERGAVAIQEPKTVNDEHGSVIIATVRTYGDTTHTFVNRTEYNGVFMPGFKPHHLKDPVNQLVPQPDLLFIDHCVGN